MTGRTRTFKGIGASPGVAIGRVYLLDRRKVRAPRFHIQPDQVEYEIARLKRAIDTSVEQLEAIRSRFTKGGTDHQTILEAHEMMLRDQALLDEAVAHIKAEHVNAEWAVGRVIARLRTLFDKVSDAYIRERRGDIDFVGDRILRNLVGQSVDLNELQTLQQGTVVVAHDLSPVDAAVLSRHHVTAFVTEVGGKTSHTSIIARSLEVPAIVGAHGIVDAVGSGDLIIVDGFDGSVLLRPTRAQLDRSRERGEQFRRMNLDLLEARALPTRTLDGWDVTVAGNIELPHEVASVLNRGGDSIGLYRTEFLFLGRGEAPHEEDHYRTYCRIFDEVGDREVTVRTFDLGGDKIFGPAALEAEPNPALGLRAIRFCFDNPEVFEPQLAGLLRAATRGRLRIMLPMISDIGEVRRARELIAEVARRLQREGKEYSTDVPVGIMVEVPSAAICAESLARECDFFAVGTNDLMQYLLAIDRSNERVDYLYRPLHPAVLRTLQLVTRAARKEEIPVSVCGEMAGDIEHTAILVGLGFTQLSMNAASIPRIKRVVRELRRDECEELTDQALAGHSPQEVEELVRAFMRQKVQLSLNPSEWSVADGE